MDINPTIKQRTILVFFGLCIMYAIIIANLFFLQIWNAFFFSSLAKQQHSILVEQHGPRAPIIDRNGAYLALNKEVISVFITPNQLKEPEKTSHFLAEFFPTAFKRLQHKKSSKFMYVKRRLSIPEIEHITQADCKDLHLIQEQGRFYPLESAGPLVGITDIDNHGLFGIELEYEKLLTGEPSIYYVEKDARSGFFYFKHEERKKGTSGSPIQLSIDSTLQFLVDQELQKTKEQFNAQEVAAVVMDPSTGHIIAISNYPRFNNTQHIDDLALTKNKCVTESYELGSVIKVFTALAALQEGIVTPDELIDCKNKTSCYLDGRKVNTWKAQGVIPFSEVIASSNNIGIATVAKRLDSKLYDHFTRMGFGTKTGIAFPGEAQGFVNHPSHWSKQSIISLSYGYEVTATLLQLACAFCLIANNGKPITPTLLYNHPSSLGPQQYDAEHIGAIKKILALTAQQGTGYRSAIKGYDVMCKTGTTNLLENGKYQPDKHAFTCAGIVQKDEYQRVIVVFVHNAEHKRLYASQVAAPLFERIAQKTIIHEHII